MIVDEVCEVVNLSEDQIENNNINSNHVKIRLSMVLEQAEIS